MNDTTEIALLLLQGLQVTFLATHDWVPLGRLNDVAAVRRQDSSGRLIVVTLIQTVPFAVGLAACVRYLHQPYPGWVWRWLWISYGILFVGQLRAWWVPYLWRPEPERAARYAVMFGNTHAFLPRRHGMVRTPRTSCCTWRRSPRC